MLATHHASELIEQAWHKLGCEVKLPDNWADFFEHTGLVPCDYDDRRTYARLHLRGKAIVRYEGAYYAIYTRDVSRGGIAFYHKQQLFPGQRGRIWLTSGLSHDIEIARCRLRYPACYECGARFVKDQDD
jgi:hypothetical protein